MDPQSLALKVPVVYPVTQAMLVVSDFLARLVSQAPKVNTAITVDDVQTDCLG